MVATANMFKAICCMLLAAVAVNAQVQAGPLPQPLSLPLGGLCYLHIARCKHMKPTHFNSTVNSSSHCAVQSLTCCCSAGQQIQQSRRLSQSLAQEQCVSADPLLS
jgi:hypothetical protein